MKELEFPSIPVFDNGTIENCRRTNHYEPIFFEMYKHVAIVCSIFSCIVPDTESIRNFPKLHFEVLIGLLNRCARLMLANTALSHEGKFGETTAIIDRCILESAINIKWLCQNSTEDSFNRYLADGLKADIELESEINKNITARDQKILVIEQRMIKSINRCINMSHLEKENILKIPKLPNFAARLQSIGFDRTLYTVIQRMGSHHVHGSWSSLLFHYLEEENGKLLPRDHPVATNVVQYIHIPLLMVDAMSDFIYFITADEKIAEPYLAEINKIREVFDLYRVEEAGNDFDMIKA